MNSGDPHPRSISGRRSVTQHIVEVFSRTRIRDTLTVAQIASQASTQYAEREISHGAVVNRLRANAVPGVRLVEGISPITALNVSVRSRSD